MTSYDILSSPHERLISKDKFKYAARLGAVATLLAAGQMAESGLPANPLNPLYQESKTNDVINVAVVDYTDVLNADELTDEIESILQQTTQVSDGANAEQKIDFDVDVLQPGGVFDAVVERIPNNFFISPFLADAYSERAAYDPSNPVKYESVVSVVGGGGRGVQLLPQTRYSQVSHHEGESETDVALTVGHELLHQYELGHVWSYDWGQAKIDFAGRRFIDIHENSRAAEYRSYDEHTANIMGGITEIEQKDGQYVAAAIEAHSETDSENLQRIDLTGLQLDKLYEHTEGYQSLGVELTPDTKEDSMFIAIGEDATGASYVKARYPNGLEWDDNAKFDIFSGYRRIAIDALVLEPVTYERDGTELVEYRLYMTDNGDVPQMLYLNDVYEPHDSRSDSSQLVSVNGLAFQVDYVAADRLAKIRAIKDQQPLGGW